MNVQNEFILKMHCENASENWEYINNDTIKQLATQYCNVQKAYNTRSKQILLHPVDSFRISNVETNFHHKHPIFIIKKNKKH